MEEFWNNHGDLIVDYGVRVLGVLVVFIIGKMIAKALGRFVEKRLNKRDFDKTLTKFFSDLTRTLIMVVVVLAALGIFGIETTSVVAVLGAAAFAVGLALQGSLANFAAGVMLIIFRPYKVGDFVKVAGEHGTVDSLGIFTTTLDTLDNRRVVIPNGAIFGGTIENLTHHELRRVDVPVGADYGADIDETRKVLESAIPNVAHRAEGAAHQVYLAELGGSSVDWQVRVWAKQADWFTVRQETIRAVKAAMDAAKIGIPYPQMDVHVDGKLG